MAEVPAALARVMEELGRLPGIGPKTAQRLSFYILRTPRESVDRLAAALTEVKARIRFCNDCFVIAEGEATAAYLAEQLAPSGVPTSRLAHGLPVGGELEYADELTLARAFSGRRAF